MGKRKFIVDCDMGTDDAQAVMMLLSKFQPDIDLLAITAVFGNAPIDNTAHNALRLLKFCNRLDVPVFKGCGKPMLGGPLFADGFHGKDGFGDFEEEDRASIDLLQKEHAVQALVRLVNENEGEVTLVALGPLTNLAMATHMDPQLGYKLKDCFIMGGNTEARGNASVCAEYNFKSDPEAAYFVLNHLGKLITMISLEVCYEYSFEWDWYNQFTSLPTEKAKYVREMDLVVAQRMRNQFKSDKYWAWDQLAMATALDDKVAMETTEAYVTVELHGELTRAQMVVDWKNKLKKPANARLVRKVNTELYKKYMYQAVDCDIGSQST